MVHHKARSGFRHTANCLGEVHHGPFLFGAALIREGLSSARLLRAMGVSAEPFVRWVGRDLKIRALQECHEGVEEGQRWKLRL